LAHVIRIPSLSKGIVVLHAGNMLALSQRRHWNKKVIVWGINRSYYEYLKEHLHKHTVWENAEFSKVRTKLPLRIGELSAS
jgi:hypothetical protein